VALSEFEPLFLNGVQRSVNRKVQGSNPWSGAKSEYEFRLQVNYLLTAVQQPYSNEMANVASDKGLATSRVELKTEGEIRLEREPCG
jgi:hypothetical protein